MKRYFVEFAYDGTNYHGWQIQPNGNSVQEELQKALSTIIRENIEVVGAGRTDAGVHARRMTAHFETDVAIDCAQLAYKLNRLLPRDISVYGVRQVADDMHARFSATLRTYHYYIHTRKNPFLRAYSCEMHYDLDFSLMNEAAAILLQTEDFAAFCKTHTDVKTTLCNVMVRAVVGTLIEVGRHRITIDQFREIIASGSRSKAGESMPACALFLEDVRYDA